MGATADTSAAEKDDMISLRLPAVLVSELRAVARENERSLSAEARLALKAWLARTEKEA
jgi:hypothetical protein